LCLESVVALALLSFGAVVHAYNAFEYPRYQLDEGTYISNAWAILHGQITPYTYTYGHPPLGWLLMGLWIQVSGGFFSFGAAINSGRVFMLVIYVLSAALVYLIARRLTASPWVGLLAMALFSFSPMSIQFQREVLLDNIATFWMLLALYLLLSGASRLRFVVGGAVVFGIACLTKETMVVLLPAFILAVWRATSPSQRRFALVVFSYCSIALISSFVLFAALKGELFPTDTFLGGSNPHVSLISTLAQQAGRGSDAGSFPQQWAAWWHADEIFMIAGLVGLAGTVLMSWRWLDIRAVPLMALLYGLFLARGGVTLSYYLLPLIPLLALAVALTVYGATEAAAAAVAWITARSRAVILPVLVPVLILPLLALLTVNDLRSDQPALQLNGTTPEVSALEWVGMHVPRSAVVVANPYMWLDMRASGGLASGYGVPFDEAQTYWEVATDPAIGQTVLHNDWNNIDFVLLDPDMLADAHAFNMTLILQALQHSIAVAKFQNPLYYVTVYQVQHRSRAAA
jgi:4-amino-4-deoxy-L-arabinose transferase-like glycosyltransferase